MKKTLLFVTMSILNLLFLKCYSQSVKLQNSVQYNVESGIFLSNGTTPFWQRANQYGTVPNNGGFLTLRGELEADYKKDSLSQNKHFFGIGGSFWGVANVGRANQAILPEGYLKAHLGKFEFWGGRRRETFGLVSDTTLSTGAYSWSGNALPLPKIQINTLGFVEIPFTKGWLAFKGSFAHGWFGDLKIPDNYTVNHLNTYLHQTSFFGRAGKPSSKFRVYAGFVHNAQWGNEDKYLDPNLSFIESLVGVAIGTSVKSSRIGNHLGSIDFGFDMHGKNWNIIFMRQTAFEAGALYWLRAIPDGLNSLSFVRKVQSNSNPSKVFIKKITLEFLHTTNQGGAIRDTVIGIYGQEQYFNHYIYSQGWSYQNKIIGTPFITRTDDAKPIWPTSSNSNNSRVYVWHVGALGTYQNWNWQTKLSLSQNWGNYGGELAGKPLQFSGIFMASKPISLLGGCELKTSLSFDIGQLYYNSIGLYVGIKKQGILSAHK